MSQGSASVSLGKYPHHSDFSCIQKIQLGAPHRTAPFSSPLDRASLSAHARRRPRPTSTRLRAAHPERPASRRGWLWACALAPRRRPSPEHALAKQWFPRSGAGARQKRWGL